MKRKKNEDIEKDIRRKVEEKYEERTGLIAHLVAYLIVNLMLWAIFLFSAGSFPWPLFVTGGWGIGMISHFLSYHNEHGAGAEKREAAIAAEVERKYRLARMRAETDHGLVYESAGDDDADVYELDNYEPRRLRLTHDGELAEVDTVDEERADQASSRP